MRFGPSPDGGRRLCRLTERSQFKAVASGRRFHTERVTVQALRREGGDEGGLRVGLTLTKRVGHATERNRIRRRLRSAIVACAAEHGALPLDVVLLGRRQALTADYATLVDDLGRALRSATAPRSRNGGRAEAGGRSRDRPGPATHPGRQDSPMRDDNA